MAWLFAVPGTPFDAPDAPPALFTLTTTSVTQRLLSPRRRPRLSTLNPANSAHNMDGNAAHLPEDAPPAYTEVPIHVDAKPEAPLATAPDGNPVLESEANIVAQTVELPPDNETSADARLDLKDPDVKDIGWNKDMGHLPPTIVNGLSNEDLFLLVRRFNKVRGISVFSSASSHDVRSNFIMSKLFRNLLQATSTSRYLRTRSSLPTSFARTSSVST